RGSLPDQTIRSRGAHRARPQFRRLVTQTRVPDALETLASLFEHAGAREYFGEAVSVSVHMLQAGALAEASGAPDHLVAAALLHDVGHLRTVHDGGDDR